MCLTKFLQYMTELKWYKYIRGLFGPHSGKLSVKLDLKLVKLEWIIFYFLES